MRINTNVSSLNAWRNLTGTDGAMGKNLERLSSGYRINRAGDDVAGLAISENMRAQVKGLNQAIKNAQDGISMLQTAEGSLNEVHTMLHRMRELAVQSANGTLQPEDRKQIQTEMDNLTKEVTRITNATQFNSKDLLDGSLMDGNIQSVTLQIGPNGGQTVNFSVGRMDAASLGIGRDVLTGIVDNGTGGAVVTNNLIAGTIANAAPTASTLAAGNYEIRATAGAGAVAGDPITTLELWAQGGSAAIATTAYTGAVSHSLGGMDFVAKAGLTVGVATQTFTVTSAGGGGAAPSNIVGEVVEVGAGITADNYEVRFDAGTNKVRLYDKSGTAIGVEADFKANETVTIGDVNTARTITVKLGATIPTVTAPATTVSDTLRIGSAVGEVKSDAQGIISSAAGQGVVSVGWGLKGTAADYTVKLDSTGKYQLFQGSNAIGTAKAANASGFVTIGDDTTGRTVELKVNTVASPAAGATKDATISITNNEQSSLAANFSGGVKLQNSQVFAGLNVSSTDGARAALAKIDEAIGKVSYQRSQLGAITNRLDHTINNLSVVSENLTASESRIRDVDMALEMTQFTKSQILMQSGTAMLAQANQKNQAILSLLR